MFIEINPRTSAISVKVISFFEISFVTRKIVSGTTRFPPLPLHLFDPRYDQILSPSHPPRLSCQEYLFFFVLIQSANSRTTVKTCLQWHCIILSTHSVLNAIPMGDDLIQVWLYWRIVFVLTSSIKPKLYPWLTPPPLISLIFPKLLTVAFVWKLLMQECSN